MTYQAAHKQGAHRLPLCVAPQIHFQRSLSMRRRCLVRFDNVVNHRSRIRKKKIYESQVTKAAAARFEGPQPVSPAVCQCPTPPLKRPSAKKKASGVASPRFHPHLSSFIADDVCVRQAPRRPNPLPVRIRDCGAIHTRSLLGKRHESSVAESYLVWLPG